MQPLCAGVLIKALLSSRAGQLASQLWLCKLRESSDLSAAALAGPERDGRVHHAVATLQSLPRLALGLHNSQLSGAWACLPAAALAVLGTLDDARQVQQLDFGAPVAHHARDARQRGKLVRRHLHRRPVFAAWTP